ncbi:hypothetical protein PT974_11081 [Cladobotryum mycophilum]|uniref:Cupin 2 conserved barrel domain-containing protein n=1 Tax=Cladobotryum mycophilum TaxID=491253 RepID=A0ABR0SC59_9HYPO
MPDVIERGLPNAVIYDLSLASQVTITLPSASTWSSELHWHETHTEYLKVIKGSIKVRLGRTEQIVTATETSQPEIKVDRFVWHEWKRATSDGEDVIVVERTDPGDGDKAIFFWNLNGVILNAGKLFDDHRSLGSYLSERFRGLIIDLWVTFNLFIIFRSLDNFPVFINVANTLPTAIYLHNTTIQKALSIADWAASHFILGLASWFGHILGIRPVRPEYTPAKNYALWLERQRDQSGREKIA